MSIDHPSVGKEHTSTSGSGQCGQRNDADRFASVRACRGDRDGVRDRDHHCAEPVDLVMELDGLWGLLATAIVLTSCSGAPPAPDGSAQEIQVGSPRGSPSASPDPPSPHSSAQPQPPSTTRPATAPLQPTIGFTYVGPGVGLVELITSTDTQFTCRLLLTNDFTRWSDVTPAQVRSADPLHQACPESASFLDGMHGWVTMYSGGVITATVYATDDGGRHWRALDSVSQSLHAGHFTSVQRIDDRFGVRATVQPVGGETSVSVTRDGGHTWKIASSNRQARAEASGLRVAPVWFIDQTDAIQTPYFTCVVAN